MISLARLLKASKPQESQGLSETSPQPAPTKPSVIPMPPEEEIDDKYVAPRLMRLKKLIAKNKEKVKVI